MKAWFLTLFALFALYQAQTIRLFNGALNAGSVSLALNGIPYVTNVQFGVASNYVPTMPGVFSATILVPQNGTTGVISQLTVQLAAGNTYTFAYYGNQANVLCLLVDSPAALSTLVRFVHLSECAPPVQPLIGFNVAGTFPSPLPYGGVTDYVAVPVGTFSVGFRDATTFVALASSAFTYLPGTAQTVFLTGCPGTFFPLAARVALDQAPLFASAPAPVGPISAR